MTTTARVFTLTLTAALAAGLLGQALLAGGSPATRLTVPTIDCPGCAKNVANQVKKVPGVATVATDVEAKTLTVVPQPSRVLSPRALWEAVEKARHKPSKLEGPSGTFTAKPSA
jgi:Cu+-exporting ATPase